MARAYRSVAYGRGSCSSSLCGAKCVSSKPIPCPPKNCPEDLVKKMGFFPWRKVFECLSREELFQLVHYAEGFRVYGDRFDSDLSVILVAAHFVSLQIWQEMLESSYLGVAANNQIDHPFPNTGKDSLDHGWGLSAYGIQYLSLQTQPRNFAMGVAG